MSSAPGEPLVEVKAVSVSYGTEAALNGVSLDIPPGAYVVLLGPSGSGKTTLLNVLGGFLEPQSGAVRIGGRDMAGIAPSVRPTTTVFQDYALFPHMTVGDNIGFGLRMRGMPREVRDERARAMLDLVGLAAVFGKRPHELSGGQRQRVALARALVVEPLVLLLDEPLGALDLGLRRQMQDELKALQRRIGTTFVHVTHDQEEAMALADVLVVMNQGHVEDAGTPQRVYERPATLFAARFMGEVTLVPGTVADKGGAVATAFGTIPVPAAALNTVAVGQAVLLAARPEHLFLGAPDAGDTPLGMLTVSEVVFQGQHKRVLGSLHPSGTPGGAIPVSVRVLGNVAVQKGVSLPLHVRSSQALVFPSG